MSKTFNNVRVQHKRDTSENWAKAINFIPLAGEIIFYTDLNKIKIGDGITNINQLEFTDNDKVDKIIGKGLSTNDYTDIDMHKLATIATGPQASTSSTAGAKGWKWNHVDVTVTPDITLGLYVPTYISGISVGDRVSIKAGYSWNFFGTVSSVNGADHEIFLSTTVPQSQWPDNFRPLEFTDSDSGYFWLPDKPDAGVFPIGNGALAVGVNNKANEQGAIISGKNNIADGRYSAVFGTDNEGGYSTLVQGDTNKAAGVCSMAVGQQNEVSGSTSAAIGYGNNVSGDVSIALGKNNTVSGNYANAEGSTGMASGNYSHTEGYGAQATNVCAHAEGDSTKATGVASHAEGYNTTASGLRSHAEGQDSQALGSYSHAQGLGTVADRDNQSVRGRYNSRVDKVNFVDVVGWGESDNNRKNIYALGTDGTLRLKGDVYVGCNDDSTGGTKLGQLYCHNLILNSADVNKLNCQIRITNGSQSPMTKDSFITNILSTAYASASNYQEALAAIGSFQGKPLYGVFYGGTSSTMKVVYIDSNGDLAIQNGVSFLSLMDKVFPI